MAEKHQSSNQPEATPTNDRQQPDGVAALRPLAPKPLPPLAPLPRLLPLRSSSSRGQSEQAAGTTQWRRRSPITCTVCYRTGCQLPTHLASIRRGHSSGTGSGSISPDKPPNTGPQLDLAFSSSYAYQAAQQYANPDVAVAPGGVVPEYNFPLEPEMNTPEMRRIFHTWFTIEARDVFRIPRPPELVGDLIVSPFFLLALKDPLLCLAVLTSAEAGDSLLQGHHASKIKSLTLLDRAVHEMRERIKADPSNISDITIVAATILWTANILMEDNEGIKSHGKAVFAFVETRKGLNKLGMVGAIEQLIRWCDAVQSFLLVMPCHYHDAPDPGLPSKLPSRRYGSYWDHHNSNTRANVSDTVRVLCQDTCRELEILEHIDVEGISMRGYTRYLQRMCVLYTRASVLKTQTYEGGQVNACISIATSLLYFHCLQDWKYFQAGGRTNIAALAMAIRSTGGPRFWQEDLGLLTWLLIVAIVIPVDNNEEKVWCFNFLCRIIVTRFVKDDRLVSTWKTDLEASLHQFVWCDLRLQEIFDQVCLHIKQEIESNLDQSDNADKNEEGEMELDLDRARSS